MTPDRDFVIDLVPGHEHVAQCVTPQGTVLVRDEVRHRVNSGPEELNVAEPAEDRVHGPNNPGRRHIADEPAELGDTLGD